MCPYYMVNRFIEPPAGLPNEGLRKKLNQWLYTRKNLLRQEVFFLRAARINWGYLENATVRLTMCCSVVCLYFSKCLYWVSEIPVSADSGVRASKSCRRANKRLHKIFEHLCKICIFERETAKNRPVFLWFWIYLTKFLRVSQVLMAF